MSLGTESVSSFQSFCCDSNFPVCFGVKQEVSGCEFILEKSSEWSPVAVEEEIHKVQSPLEES